jgi:hypothetical protein
MINQIWISLLNFLVTAWRQQQGVRGDSDTTR